MHHHLIFEDNTVYEIDPDCVRRMKQSGKQAQWEKERNASAEHKEFYEKTGQKADEKQKRGQSIRRKGR